VGGCLGSLREREQQLTERAVGVVSAVGGERVREVWLRVPEGEYDEVRGLSQADTGDAEVTGLADTLYLDSETDRPRRVAVDTSMWVGQEAGASVAVTFGRFGENVSVTVPEEAETTVEVPG